MTAAKTTRTRRPRKPRTSQELMPRTPAIDPLAADFLILSSRLAVTRPPVFWAEGELAARTNWVDPADDTYDDNYRNVFGDDPWWDWNWYKDAKLADELDDIPVCTLTVVPASEASIRILPAPVVTGELPANLDERIDRIWALAEEQFPDVPAPDEGDSPPGSPSADTDSAPGAGTQDDGDDDDNALD